MNINLATEYDENLKEKITRAHEKVGSWYVLGIHTGVSDWVLRNYVKGKPVSEAVMVRLQEWSKDNE